MSYHKLIFAGRLSQDPEMRYTPDGTPVTNLSIPVNEKWTGKDGQQNERTTWYRVSVWSAQGENCNKYLSKGSAVIVDGRLNPDPDTGGPRVYTKNDGSSGASYEVTALTVRFLSTRGEGGSKSPSDDEVPPETGEEDSIPF